MRELKFRAWDKIDKKMSPSFNIGALDRYDNDCKWVLNDSYEIPMNSVFMQYTGYQMKGQEVYFGDLVSNNFGTDKEVVREVVEYKGNKMLKRVKGKSSFPEYISLHQFYQLNFKIIGNKNQNPELLK